MFSRLIVAIVGLLAVSSALAQTPTPTVPPDVFWARSGSVYPGKAVAPTDADLVEVCFVRVDTEPDVELGCVTAEPGATVGLDLSIVSDMGTDAKIRAYATDTSGFKSDLSPNEATADFTAPSPPFVLSAP